MFAKVRFEGPLRYRTRSAIEAAQVVTAVSTRRLFKGPRRPTWNWWVEVATALLNRQLTTAFGMAGPQEARIYLDSMVVRSRAMEDVTITLATEETFRGHWFTPSDTQPHRTVLYLHGGGYSFYPKSYANFIALFTLAAKSRTFALDYRLSPEHRFPSQLEDAVCAYRWLLDCGVSAEELVVAGDSAGGNLTLGLLLRLRDAHLPLPSLAVAISPATNFTIRTVRPCCDWINPAMMDCWADWFCDPVDRCNPLVSPALAELSGLPPIYIQAGHDEFLYDSILAFTEVAQHHGADVTLDAWDHMNHDFQMFGPDAPQSAEALRRIGEVISKQTQRRELGRQPVLQIRP
jgi:monoterpene epsilon-lactone hydrolase